VDHTFSVQLPFDFDAETFDVFDIEPDLDGIDWVELDPQIADSPTLFVRGRSTRGVQLQLDGADLTVVVPTLASAADWDTAFVVLTNVCNVLDNVMVTWNDEDAMDLVELQETHDCAWQQEQSQRDSAELVAKAREHFTAAVPGPIRSVHIGPDMAAQVDSGRCSVEDILLRTNYPPGRMHLAVAVEETIAGRPMVLAVLGPDLRTLLPRCDVVLIESGSADEAPVLVDARALDQFPGVTVTRLDEHLRLVEAVPEAQWADVVAAARLVALI
jgi:hypothetical protein